MAEYPYDNDVAIDPVKRAADARIRREALRQLNTVDIEDDDSRIERFAKPISTEPEMAPEDAAHGSVGLDGLCQYPD